MSASLTNQLLELSAGGEARFSVELSGAPILLCEKIVRRVPNKRLVCQCVWRGKAVFAKLFLGKHADKYSARDKYGIELLVKAGIATPEILYAGSSTDGSVYVLILDAIGSSQNAEVCWHALRFDASQRLALAKNLVAQVAEHHRAGLIQTDLYFKNFLIQDNRIFTLDGDGIRRLSSIFRERQKLHNLATLFSKMDVLDDRWIPELFDYYCMQMGVASSPFEQAHAWYLAQKIRRKVASGYADKKVFRTCSDVNVTQNSKRFVAVASGFNAKDFSEAFLDSQLEDKNTNLKNGNTCTISKTMIAGAMVVIKRYNIKNFWHGLNRAFRTSRAAKSWANAYRLMISGIATPKPVALIEERLGWFRRRAYFLSEYVDAPDALQYFAGEGDKEHAAKNLAALFYKLYLLKLSHGDCKASNIKIVEGMPVLIDLDGMKAHSIHWMAERWFKRQHVKDLARLMENWANNAEVTALLKQAFVQQYLAYDIYEEDDILIRAKIA